MKLCHTCVVGCSRRVSSGSGTGPPASNSHTTVWYWSSDPGSTIRPTSILQCCTEAQTPALPPDPLSHRSLVLESRPRLYHQSPPISHHSLVLEFRPLLYHQTHSHTTVWYWSSNPGSTTSPTHTHDRLVLESRP